VTDKEIDKALKSSRNLFITGAAGTGKTYFLNKFIAETPNVLTCASTGIAAINVGGDTAHRVFHIPVPAFDAPSFAKNKKGAITKAQLNVIAKADVIIIDEISLLRNEAFRFLVKVLRKAEKEKGSKIRLIVVGDFSQLPPVVKKTELNCLRNISLMSRALLSRHRNGSPVISK
jgi:DNA replication protein DnaC